MSNNTGDNSKLRTCLRDAIPEIADAARLLDGAVSAHLLGRHDLSEQLIRLANIPAIRDWTESLWGKNSPHVQYRPSKAPPLLSEQQRVKLRMPIPAEKNELHRRDGYHCRFCGIPVVRKEVRQRIRTVYPDALPWGRTNRECHAAFQAMWAQYDHILPHARGGTNDLSNVVVTCAPCNYGRMQYCLEEVGLIDPRERQPLPSMWDGLERFR
jgi:hypothetical protein